MNLLNIASSLWQQTHLLKTADLALIHSLQLENADEWISLLTNQKLKDYLKFKPNWLNEARLELETLDKNNISYLSYFSDLYPEAFKNTDSPPLFISYIGSLDCLHSTCLSVVGSREPSRDATHWLESSFYQTLKKYQLTIISGAAIGIDQYAHSLATFCLRPTVAILPSGLGRIYPQVFEKQIDDILSKGGAVISEYAFDQIMRKHHFHQRNRMIAALGQALLVVEAKRKSGSLITAKYAVDMGRDVLILPSSPFEENKLGSLDLLFDGALPVRDALDLISYLDPHLTKSNAGYNNKDTVRNP